MTKNDILTLLAGAGIVAFGFAMLYFVGYLLVTFK